MIIFIIENSLILIIEMLEKGFPHGDLSFQMSPNASADD